MKNLRKPLCLLLCALLLFASAGVVSAEESLTIPEYNESYSADSEDGEMMTLDEYNERYSKEMLSLSEYNDQYSEEMLSLDEYNMIYGNPFLRSLSSILRIFL